MRKGGRGVIVDVSGIHGGCSPGAARREAFIRQRLSTIRAAGACGRTSQRQHPARSARGPGWSGRPGAVARRPPGTTRAVWGFGRRSGAEPPS